MKKSSFVAMILGTVGGVLFALGMCMALIPEWDAFKPGLVFAWDHHAHCLAKNGA